MPGSLQGHFIRRTNTDTLHSMRSTQWKTVSSNCLQTIEIFKKYKLSVLCAMIDLHENNKSYSLFNLEAACY